MAVTKTSLNSIKSFSRFDNNFTNNPYYTGVFTMFGPTTGSTSYCTSPDGITWTARADSNLSTSWGGAKVGNYLVNFRQNAAYSVIDPVTGGSLSLSTFGIINGSNTHQGADYVNGNYAYWGDYGWAWGSFVTNNGAGTNVTGMAYGNGTWVVIRANTIYYATASSTAPLPTSWNSATSAVTATEKVLFANGLFVVTGSNGIATSTDGITWTKRSSAGSFNSNKLIYAGGLYFAGISSGAFYTSPDAITWTARSTMTSSALVGAAYGAGVWVVMSSTGLLWSSPDGSTWTSRTNAIVGGSWQFGSGVNGPSVILFG